ncbi:MAG: hypothetical protein ACFFFG_05490 [Candidatus Thorarchaeota archaeon]
MKEVKMDEGKMGIPSGFYRSIRLNRARIMTFSCLILSTLSIIAVPSQALPVPSRIEPLDVTVNFEFAFYKFRTNYGLKKVESSWRGILDLHPRFLNGSYNIKVLRLDVENVSLIIHAAYVLCQRYDGFDNPTRTIEVDPVIFNDTIGRESVYSGTIIYTKLGGSVWASAETDWNPVPYCSYEAFTNYSVFGYCTFSAELEIKNKSINWGQNLSLWAEIEFTYHGFQDSGFYQFLQERHRQNIQIKNFWKVMIPCVGLFILGSLFTGLWVLFNRGKKRKKSPENTL